MRLIFMGTPDFAVPALRALVKAGHDVGLVATQPDRPKGRSRAPAPPPVKAAAEELGLRVIQPEKMSDPGVMEALKEAAPEAMVVAAFGHILRPEVLTLPPLGCVNAHASLLPRWRGAAPIPAAIAAGDPTTGVTTMLMDAGLDTGAILLRAETRIEPDDTCGTLHDRLAELAAGLVAATLAGLAQGRIEPVPQDDSLATYAPRLTKDDGRIDWREPAEALARKVRAYNPWPGSFTHRDGAQLKVMAARAEAGSAAHPPGSVVAVGREGIVVSCGEGALRLIDLQPAGKRRMSAEEYLAGHPPAKGARFK